MTIDWELVQGRIARCIKETSGLAESKILWSDPKSPRPAADGITLRIMTVGTIQDNIVDFQENPLEFDDLTVSAVSAVANTLTSVAHGLATGDGPVQISSTIALPASLQVDTNYWVIRVDADTIKLAATFVDTGGADVEGSPSGNTITAIDLTTAGSGTITLSSTEDTLRAGEEILYVSRGQLRVTLTVECHSALGTKSNMAAAILQRVAGRMNLPSQRDLLEEAGVGVIEVEPVRSVRGHSDALMFEPRAVLDIQLAIVSEESEPGTIIQTADIQPTINDVEFDEVHYLVGGYQPD